MHNPWSRPKLKFDRTELHGKHTAGCSARMHRNDRNCPCLSTCVNSALSHDVGTVNGLLSACNHC